MTNKIIYVESDAVEAVAFVEWLNENGHEAEITNDQCQATYSDDVNELWEKYCNS